MNKLSNISKINRLVWLIEGIQESLDALQTELDEMLDELEAKEETDEQTKDQKAWDRVEQLRRKLDLRVYEEDLG